jgi:hypothetical protein
MPSVIVTYNQVINLMRSFVSAHPQLNDFGNGPTSEIGKSRQMDFPYMFSTHEQDSIFRIVNKNITPELNFTVMFLDKVNDQNLTLNRVGDDSTNTQEILSDTYQYAQDFLNEVLTNWSKYGIAFSQDDVTAFPVYDETTDRVSGWAVRIALRLKYYNCD